MRILAIDYGRKKIGLAISNDKVAEPKSVIRYKYVKEVLAKISEVIENEKIERVVVGISEGKMEMESRSFARALREIMKLHSPRRVVYPRPELGSKASPRASPACRQGRSEQNPPTRFAKAKAMRERKTLHIPALPAGRHPFDYAQGFLRRRIKVPVVTYDETLSTHDAQNLSIKAGLKRKKRKNLEDAYAAAIMLQNYLDSNAQN